jgi:hypothetical protein
MTFEENVEQFTAAFHIVREKGFIYSARRGNTGIGKTFEDAVGVLENNNATPDFGQIEIKSQRQLATSRVTLFTKSPTMPKNANTFLRNNFGSPDREYPEVKVLHTSVFHNRFNTHISGFGFKLECSDYERKMYLLIKNLSTEEIISREVYWTYEVLQKTVNSKLQMLAFVDAETMTEGEIEKFHFTNCTLFYGLRFNQLLDFAKGDKLMFDIRIGAYKSGRMNGKTHDHGSGFRVKSEDLYNLYDEHREL